MCHSNLIAVNVCSGKWRANQKHGDGSYLFHNGNMYKGEWLHDRATGTGTCVYSNGDKYAGAWLQDRAHGKGVYTYSGGELYDGDWVHGKKTGRGVRFPAQIQLRRLISLVVQTDSCRICRFLNSATATCTKANF